MVDKNGKIKFVEEYATCHNQRKGTSSQQLENRYRQGCKIVCQEVLGDATWISAPVEPSSQTSHQPPDLALEDQASRSMNPKQLQGAKVQLNKGKGVAAFEKVLAPAKKECDFLYGPCYFTSSFNSCISGTIF